MKIGLFGLIGAGKTTVINYLKKTYNFQILDLDEISKLVLAQDKTITFIRNAIPEAYNLKNKMIDRSKLRTVLFTNKKKNKLFAQVVWPEIGAIANTILAKMPSDKNIAVEGAILPILGIKLDKIILIETKKKRKNIKRVTIRDQRKATETKSLIKIQKAWIKNANFDVLIKNDSTIENLFLKIDQLMVKCEIEKVH